MHATALTNILGPDGCVPDRGLILSILDVLGQGWSKWLPSLPKLATQCADPFIVYHDRAPTTNGFLTVPGLSQLPGLLFRLVDEGYRAYSRCLSGLIQVRHKACTCYSSIRLRASNGFHSGHRPFLRHTSRHVPQKTQRSRAELVCSDYDGRLSAFLVVLTYLPSLGQPESRVQRSDVN